MVGYSLSAILFLVLLCIDSRSVLANDDIKSDAASSVLSYSRPARSWMTEALPIGNGSLGAMLFGLTETERVQFNHDTLWTGHEKDTGSYQSFGDVFIRLGHGNPLEYRRELNIDNALEGVPDIRDRKLPSVSLVFEACDSITLVLAAGTDYLADQSKGWRGNDPHTEVTACVDAVSSEKLSDLCRAHVTDYQSLYRRFRLDLGSSAKNIANRATDERLLSYSRENAKDPDLEELLVNYGRYLLISSSRPGSMPANLQGLWNDSNRPPWRSDYHSNINVEMNYWPGEPTNLAECQKPFLDYVLSQIPVSRERTREEYKQTKRGWTVRTENGVFGGGSYLWNPPGSAWYAQHFWEHYAFSQDKDYLRNVAYPLLKELCGLEILYIPKRSHTF
ncbi:MAG TPA: hypothetical protein DET40_16630 [Lentisphaeria bacterium]|nr:MAG: hypothetical protein A2X45_13110 [Lentisphaerae bacterium GWF2_50_93]HCE45167.1 hypothetical protein [Lentisphaeria bacterium]